MKVKPQDSRVQLAKRLVEVYNGLMFVNTHTGHKRVMLSFDDLTPTYRQCFLKAADSCGNVAATPKNFITAQFEMFALYSQNKRRKMLPMAQQLYGMGAEARYEQFMQQAIADKTNDEKAQQTQVRAHYREDRKLSGLATAMRRSEEDVLRIVPAEFTPEFLKHKGVWKAVRATYDDQMSGDD